MAELPLFIVTLAMFIVMVLVCWISRDQRREDRARRKAREDCEVEMVRDNRPRGTYFRYTKDTDRREEDE